MSIPKQSLPALWLVGLVSLLAAGLACGSEPYVRIADPRAESQVVVTITESDHLFDEERFSETTIEYAATDRWRITETKEEGETQTVLIGEDAWQTAPDQSTTVDAERARTMVLLYVRGIGEYLIPDSKTSPGPEVAGEWTISFQDVDPDFGLKFLGMFDEEHEERNELYQDVGATRTVLIGVETHRVHYVQWKFEGINLEETSEVIFDYETPVSIEEPSQ